MRPYLAVLCVLQIPAVFAAHGCSLAKGDCNGRTSDALLCPVLAKTCYFHKTQSTCPSDCVWEAGECSWNHADSVTYDNAENEVLGAVQKYKQTIQCTCTIDAVVVDCRVAYGGNLCPGDCEMSVPATILPPTCAPKMSIIQAKLEADAYQRAAIHEGYVIDAFSSKKCTGLNEASCKATDKECQYASNSCDSSDAHDLATMANACPDTDFTAVAALMNMTMSEAYQKSGVAPENNLVTSAACDNPVNLLFFTALAVSVSFAARF